MSVVEMKARALQRFDIDDAFDDIMAAVDADGSAIVERFVSEGLLARLNAELDARIAEKPPGADAVSDRMAWFWDGRPSASRGSRPSRPRSPS